ncbi:MAG TPA: LapA family protein [Solirubrobacteraceae bacterium]|nr:LapA family protein [Solirubrobacteraceae bacterium]
MPASADPGEASGIAAPVPAGAAGSRLGRRERAPRQTLAGRVWVAIAVAAVLLVLLIIFIAENSQRVTVSFLGAHGHISEALALLIAVVVGIAITLLVGSARIVQLSRQVRRERRRSQRKA